MTEIGNRPAVLHRKGISVIPAVLIPGIFVVLYAAALVTSMTASGWYDRYAIRFGNDCGHAVSMPASVTLLMWLAVAIPAASAVIAGGLYRRLRSRDTGQSLAGLVRVLCFLLCGTGVIVTAFCIIAVLQRQPYTVTCTGP